MSPQLQEAQIIAREVERFGPYLKPNDRGFLERLFAGEPQVYRQRIGQYGLRNLGRVLDAGCGFGQWSLALARENDAVCAIDSSPERLIFLDRVAQELGLDNISVRRSDIFETGFEDASFDAIFCFSVLHLTPWRESLAEFARLLRPGGRLYVNANGFGWYRHLWATGHNAARDYDPRMTAARVLLHTLNYEKGLWNPGDGEMLVEPEQLVAALEGLGFDDIRQGAEGCVAAPGCEILAAPFFKGEYLGETGIYEVLARRADSH